MSAQVAVAVAGFAGVAAAFGSEPIHSWSHVDRMRLRFLLIGAALPLIFSLFGLALLSADLRAETISVWCSGFAFLVQCTWQFLSVRAVLRTPRAAMIQGGWNSHIYYGLWSAISALTLLQLYNLFTLRSFWLFYALLMAQIASAIMQFIRLILYRGHVHA